MANAPAVQAVTAVTADEEAIEERGNGLFTRTICDQLAEGRIFDKYERAYVTGTELFGSVSELVMQRAHEVRRAMTPMHRGVLAQHGKAQCAGEMLFLRPGGAH